MAKPRGRLAEGRTPRSIPTGETIRYVSVPVAVGWTVATYRLMQGDLAYAAVWLLGPAILAILILVDVPVMQWIGTKAGMLMTPERPDWLPRPLWHLWGILVGVLTMLPHLIVRLWPTLRNGRLGELENEANWDLPPSARMILRPRAPKSYTALRVRQVMARPPIRPRPGHAPRGACNRRTRGSSRTARAGPGDSGGDGPSAVAQGGRPRPHRFDDAQRRLLTGRSR